MTVKQILGNQGLLYTNFGNDSVSQTDLPKCCPPWSAAWSAISCLSTSTQFYAPLSKATRLKLFASKSRDVFFHSLVSSSEADSWCFSASYTRPQRTAFGNGERIRWLVGESYVRKGKFCPATTTTAMYVTLRLPPPPQDSETGWTWELWSKTNFLNGQN